ncbi:MAG TPA: hypothetical protein VE754_00325 [Actinomycetota bacterium]|jgi:hypothetical protein|nr:hypothetical protein [Actinomycetota bacterium]
MSADTPAGGNPPRLEEFEAELARLRVKGSSATDEQRLLLAGIVLMPLGLFLVMIGWFGASGTTEFSSQVPYLISGGVLGLGLTVVGAALFLRYSLARYLRFWLLRLVFEERAASDRNVEALEALGEVLGRGPQVDPSVNATAREKENQA